HLDAAFAEETREHAVNNSGPDLALDVVANHGQFCFFEAILPVLLARNKDGDTVHKANAGAQNLLNVPLRRRLGADGQVIDHHVSAGIIEDLHDVVGPSRRFMDNLGEILAQPVMGHAAIDLCPQLRHLGETIGIVRGCKNGLADILSHLTGIYIESCGKLYVPNMIAAQIHMHQARHKFVWLRLPVILDALYKGACAVAYTYHRYAYFLICRHGKTPFARTIPGSKLCKGRGQPRTYTLALQKNLRSRILNYTAISRQLLCTGLQAGCEFSYRSIRYSLIAGPCLKGFGQFLLRTCLTLSVFALSWQRWRGEAA